MSNIEDTLQKETLRETKIDLKTLQPELFQKYNYRGGYGTVSKKKVFYSVSLSIVAAFFLQNIGTYYGSKNKKNFILENNFFNYFRKIGWWKESRYFFT